MTDEEIMQGLKTACDSATGTFGWTVPPAPILLDYIQRLKAENAELKEELNNVVGYCKEVEDYSNTRIKALEARLEKAVEPPEPIIEQDKWSGNYRVYTSQIVICRHAEFHGAYDTIEEAEEKRKGLRRKAQCVLWE